MGGLEYQEAVERGSNARLCRAGCWRVRVMESEKLDRRRGSELWSRQHETLGLTPVYSPCVLEVV